MSPRRREAAGVLKPGLDEPEDIRVTHRLAAIQLQDAEQRRHEETSQAKPFANEYQPDA